MCIVARTSKKKNMIKLKLKTSFESNKLFVINAILIKFKL